MRNSEKILKLNRYSLYSSSFYQRFCKSSLVSRRLSLFAILHFAISLKTPNFYSSNIAIFPASALALGQARWATYWVWYLLSNTSIEFSASSTRTTSLHKRFWLGFQDGQHFCCYCWSESKLLLLVNRCCCCYCWFLTHILYESCYNQSANICSTRRFSFRYKYSYINILTWSWTQDRARRLSVSLGSRWCVIIPWIMAHKALFYLLFFLSFFTRVWRSFSSSACTFNFYSSEKRS